MMAAVQSPLDDLDLLLRSVDDVEVERDVPAARLCTYRVGGPISLLIRLSRRSALDAVVTALSVAGVPMIAIGKGSNLLVADAGFDGVGLVLDDEFSSIDVKDGEMVQLGGSVALPVAARATVNAGLTGFEWAVGVPGTIGGAVRMNAGGHGSDMAASLVDVEIADFMSGSIITRSVDSLDLSYRRSNVERHELVISAQLQLEPLESATGLAGAELLKDIVGWRREHQPGGANAGSVFTNPPDDSAGRLIDVAGLKGHRIGSAEVSTKHANFIQADPDGSADDVMALMVEIVDEIDHRFGVRLHAETRLVGFDPALVNRVQAKPVAPGEPTEAGEKN